MVISDFGSVFEVMTQVHQDLTKVNAFGLVDKVSRVNEP
jgi:hypothetical protein